MKIYKLKMSRDCWSSDSKPKRDKTFNSAERWRAKREIEQQLRDPETSQWREKAIKEYYELAKRYTVELAKTLSKLGIDVIHPDDQLWVDHADFAEEVIKLPKEYEWVGFRVEKI